MTHVKALSREEMGIPQTGWLGRLAQLASSGFKSKTLPQGIRQRATEEDIQHQPGACTHVYICKGSSTRSHMDVNTHTHMYAHTCTRTHTPHMHTQFYKTNKQIKRLHVADSALNCPWRLHWHWILKPSLTEIGNV